MRALVVAPSPRACAATLVSFPPTAANRATDITGSFCCHVHFLAGTHAASRWRATHPGGHAVDLDAAYELGRRAVAPLLAALPFGNGLAEVRR